LIDFKKVRHAARPSKDLRTPSLFGSSNGPTKHRTTGPRNDLTGILVCRRSTGFTDTFGCHRHLRMSTGNHHTPEPPAARRSANCAWRTPVLHTVQRIPPPSLFGSSPSVSRTLTSASGHSPEPPGSIEHLRVFTERLRAFTGAPSLHGRDFRDPPHDPQQHGQPRLSTGRLRSTNRCVMLATSVLGCSPEPPGSNRVPSETHRSQFVHTRRLTAIASFRYNGPLVRRPLAELCNVSGATVVTFESTPGFRLSLDAKFNGS